MPTRPPRAHPNGKPHAPRPPRVRRPRPQDSIYSTPEWKRASKEFRALHPRCECELHQGKPDAPKSQCVDHVTPHRGNLTLFWDRRNWKAMAWSCHTAKTNRQDGGFGNAIRPDTPTQHAHGRVGQSDRRALPSQVSPSEDMGGEVEKSAGLPLLRRRSRLSHISASFPRRGSQHPPEAV